MTSRIPRHLKFFICGSPCIIHQSVMLCGWEIYICIYIPRSGDIYTCRWALQSTISVVLTVLNGRWRGQLSSGFVSRPWIYLLCFEIEYYVEMLIRWVSSILPSFPQLWRLDGHKLLAESFWGFGDAGRGCSLSLCEMKAIDLHLLCCPRLWLPPRPSYLEDHRLASRSTALVYCLPLLFVCSWSVEKTRCKDMYWLGEDRAATALRMVGELGRRGHLPWHLLPRTHISCAKGVICGLPVSHYPELKGKCPTLHGEGWICSPCHTNVFNMRYESEAWRNAMYIPLFSISSFCEGALLHPSTQRILSCLNWSF